MEDVPARTLDVNPAPGWLTTAGTLMGRVWLAVQAFGSALRKEPFSARTRRRHVRARHTAVPRPSPPKESSELPETNDSVLSFGAFCPSLGE